MEKFFAYFVLIFIIIATLQFSAVLAESQDESNKLYVTVLEQQGDPARVVLSAKVSLAYGAIDSEHSMLGEWENITVDDGGQAVFSNLVDETVYTIFVKAPNYISTQKEFRKKPGVANVSVILKKVSKDEDAIGSARIALLKLAPQGKGYIKNGKIEIFKKEKLIASSDTSKGEVVFLDLPIGEYTVLASAPGYVQEKTKLAIEKNKQAWLSISLDVPSSVPAECPDNCKCDSEDNILYCFGEGKELTGPAIQITKEEASATAVEQAGLSAVKNVDAGEFNEKPVYTVNGVVDAKLFAFMPLKAGVKVIVSAENGSIEKIKKPWWSFLALSI